MMKIFTLLFTILWVCVGCTPQGMLAGYVLPSTVSDQAAIRAQQLTSSAMPNQITPILLPNSGSQNIRSVVERQYFLQIVSNPSTGYRWEKSYTEPLSGCLEFLRQDISYDEQEKVTGGVRKVGVPGKQEWLVQTNCAGVYRITFIYKRPWEQGPPIYQTIAILNTAKE
jgi:predicted secreted protein